MSVIRISWPDGEVTAELQDTPSTRSLLETLPFESRANTWGQEVYFKVPVTVELESDARQVVDPGTVCIWVEGQSLALPYGPTPISLGKECRLISDVNILGNLQGDPVLLAGINQGDRICVEQV